MEIFQTIWTTLITPNEQVANLVYIPMCFIEATVSMLLFTTILNMKSSTKQKIFYVLSMSAISILGNLLLSNVTAKFINLILLPFVVMLTFKTNFIKGIFAEIIPYISFSIFEPILMRLLDVCFGISSNDMSFVPIYRMTYLILMYLYNFCLYLICKHFKINITILDNMNKKNKIILCVNLIVGLISIIIQSYLFYRYNFPVTTLLGMFSLIVYFFVSMYSLIRTTKLEVTEQSLEEAQLYNKSLKILHDNVRGFKHDFSNIVQAIGGYISTNDIDGLKTYYSQLLDDCQKVNNLYTLSPEVINNPAIYSLLASKYHKADELGIQINLEVFLNLNDLNMKIYEFTRVLGILMDNAIEATNECDSKIINVQIRKDTSHNRQILVIENTYMEKDINIDKIFEKGYSSKPNNTGLGLWEVRQILTKNKNLNLYTTKNDKFFIQQLEMYNK